MSKLNPKHKKFCDEYLIDLNGSRAYKTVYADVSDESARVLASKLLTTVNVKNYLEPKARKNVDKAQLSAENVLKEIARIAFINPKNLFTVDNNLVPINELPDEIAACIESIEFHEITGKVKKYKLNSKVKGLEMLGRYFKLFTDKFEHSGPNEGPIEIVKMTDDEATKHYLDKIKG